MIALDLSADNITGLSSGSSITTWPDSSVNGWDFTGGTEKPKWYDNILNGHDVARWQGGALDRPQVSRAFQTGLSDLTTLTLFVVLKLTNVEDQRYIVHNALFSSGLAIAKGWLLGTLTGPDRLRVRINNATTWTAATTLDDDFHILTLRFDSESTPHTVGLWTDGGDPLVCATYPNLAAQYETAFTIGNGSPLSFEQDIDGDIARLKVFNTALNRVEIDDVGSSLADTYGLTWTPLTDSDCAPLPVADFEYFEKLVDTP